LGIPYRVIASKKTVENAKFELKERQSETTEELTQEDLIKLLLHDCETYKL